MELLTLGCSLVLVWASGNRIAQSTPASLALPYSKLFLEKEPCHQEHCNCAAACSLWEGGAALHRQAQVSGPPDQHSRSTPRTPARHHSKSPKERQCAFI